MASHFLRLGFGDARRKIKFRPLQDESLEGKFTDMFEDFPFASSDPEPLLELPYKARINDSDGLPLKRSSARALLWGNGIDSESSLFYPAFYIDSEDRQTAFCVKVLFNTEKVDPDSDDTCNHAIRKMHQENPPPVF